VSNLENRRILVVDDDPMIRSIVKEALRHDDYEVYTTNNGEDALALLSQISPILVLLDLRMPVMNGFQFLEHIQKERYLSKKQNLDHEKLVLSFPFSIVVMAQSHQNKDFARCYQSGVAAFLKKPFDIYELKGLVRNLVVSKQYEQTLEELVNQRDQQFLAVSNQLQQENEARQLAESTLNRIKILTQETDDSQKHLIIDISRQLHCTTCQVLNTIVRLTNQPLTVKQRQSLGKIKSSAYEIVDLAQSMLNFLQIKDEEFKKQNVNFDLRQLVVDILKIQEQQIGSQLLKISTVIAPEVPILVVGNRKIIKQLIHNIIRNVFVATNTLDESRLTMIEFQIEVETLTDISAQLQLTASSRVANGKVSETTSNTMALKLSVDQRVADLIQANVEFKQYDNLTYCRLNIALGWVVE